MKKKVLYDIRGVFLMLYGCLGLIARCTRRVCDLKGPPPRLNLTGASVCDRQTAPQKAPVTHIAPIANELHALATPYAVRWTSHPK